MKSVSVIIPTYDHKNRMDDLLDLLQSLSISSNIEYIEEIIIIDNGNSLSANPGYLKFAYHKKIKVVSEPRVGLNYARAYLKIPYSAANS